LNDFINLNTPNIEHCHGLSINIRKGHKFGRFLGAAARFRLISMAKTNCFHPPPLEEIQPSVGYLKRINHWRPMENTNTHLPEFSRCNHVKENSNSNWLKKLLASWLAIRVSKYPSIKVSKHPTNQLRVWVLRRRRNCSYALICTSFDFLVYGALIHRDCFIIYLLSVFFLQSVGRKKREEKLPMPSRRFDSNRTDRSMCLY